MLLYSKNNVCFVLAEKKIVQIVKHFVHLEPLKTRYNNIIIAFASKSNAQDFFCQNAPLTYTLLVLFFKGGYLEQIDSAIVI